MALRRQQQRPALQCHQPLQIGHAVIQQPADMLRHLQQGMQIGIKLHPAYVAQDVAIAAGGAQDCQRAFTPWQRQQMPKACRARAQSALQVEEGKIWVRVTAPQNSPYIR